MDHKLVARNPVAELPPVTVGTHGNPRVVQDAFQQPTVTRQRNPLVTVRKIAVIVIVPNRKTRDNIRRKLFRVLFPLFFRVTAEKRLVQLAADLRDSFFFQIRRRSNIRFCGKAVYKILCLIRRHCPAEILIDRAEIHRKSKHLPAENRQHRVTVAVESGKTVHIFPDFLIRRMKNV